ncbi:MAG: hypothetical protein JXQ72_00600 [Anaerolineae bacterium]|nr:hypothetical protein [Anaerolineae bacterium]
MDDVKAMAEALWLTDKLQWDIFLYLIFFLNVITLMILPDGSPAIYTMILIGVLMSAVIDKTYAFGYMLNPTYYTPEECHGEIFIGTYLIRALMFAGPLMLAGTTDKGSIRFLTIVAGILGAVYMFARWYFDQREVSSLEIMCESVGMLLVFGRLVWRRRLLVGTVNRHIPVTIPGDLAAHEIEI